jgi:hypothetical protein
MIRHNRVIKDLTEQVNRPGASLREIALAWDRLIEEVHKPLLRNLDRVLPQPAVKDSRARR